MVDKECTAAELQPGDIICDIQGKQHRVTRVVEETADCWNGTDFVPTEVVTVFTNTYPQGQSANAAKYRVTNR